MIIDPQSVSFSTIKDNLITFVKSKPDYGKWKDFYDSGVGLTLIEMIAGFGTYLQYMTVVNRRETYLFHAENRSSVVAVAETLGYSVFRGKNLHVTLTATPSSTIVIKQFDIIGSYKSYDIIALDDYALNNGVSIDIDVVFGEQKSESITAQSPDLAMFRFESPLVSEDVYLTLDGIEVPISSNLPDLLQDKYVGLTNALGAIDLMYVNNEDSAYPYDNGSVFELKYVELDDMAFNTVDDLDQVSFDYGTVTLATIISNYQIPERKETIRINAPIFHETQMVIRGRNDFKKLLFDAVPNAVDTNAIDISAAVVGLTYVREDLSVLTPAEKEDVLETMDSYRPFGVSMPELSDPTQIDAEVTITITLNTPLEGIGQSQIDSDIETILSVYEKDLEVRLDLNEIEYEVERLSYVKIARVEITDLTNDWQADTDYVLGKIVTSTTPDGYYYECTTAGTSDSSEPTWDDTPGNVTTDGTAEWTCRDPNTTYPTAGWDEYFDIDNVVVLT